MLKLRFAALASAVLLGGLGMAGGSAIALDGPGLSASTLKKMQREAGTPGKSEQRAGDMRSMLGGGIGSAYTQRDYRRAKPGWTNRHVQRSAAKKRNQARNRAAHRG